MNFTSFKTVKEVELVIHTDAIITYALIFAVYV